MNGISILPPLRTALPMLVAALMFSCAEPDTPPEEPETARQAPETSRQDTTLVAPDGPDSDEDGVPDGMDMCPNTPGSVEVDDKGCPV